MKTTTKMLVLSGAIATLLLLVGYRTAFGQGEINFFTYNVNTNYGLVYQYNGLPPDNTLVAVLLGSTNQTGPFTTISPVTKFEHNTGIGAGIINYGIVTISGVSAGTTYWYELEVWTEAAGSYAVASTTVGDQYGTSDVASLTLGGLSGSTIYPLQASDGFPSFTLTLFPPPPTLTSVTISPPGSFNFTLNGQAGWTYVILYSTDLTTPLANWTPISTNTLTGSSSNLVFSIPDSVRFYGARWAGY